MAKKKIFVMLLDRNVHEALACEQAHLYLKKKLPEKKHLVTSLMLQKDFKSVVTSVYNFCPK